jgi:hypothetical protein
MSLKRKESSPPYFRQSSLYISLLLPLVRVEGGEGILSHEAFLYMRHSAASMWLEAYTTGAITQTEHLPSRPDLTNIGSC